MPNRRNVIMIDPNGGSIKMFVYVGKYHWAHYTAELLRIDSNEFEEIADDDNTGTQPDTHEITDISRLHRAALGWTFTVASTTSEPNQNFDIRVEYQQDGKTLGELRAEGNVDQEPILSLYTIFEKKQ